MSTSAPLIDVRPDHWNIVLDLLQEHVSDRSVLAFGSRATWTAKEYSDLDLAVLGDEPLPQEIFSALSEGLKNSDLPFKVDLVDWTRTDGNLRDAIRQHGVVVKGSPTRLGESGPLLFPAFCKFANSVKWPVLSIGDCVVRNEANYSPKDMWPFVNYLDTGNITENHISEIKHLVIGLDKIPLRARRKAKSGDVIYSTVRPNQRHYGLLKQVPENFLVSTGFSVFHGIQGHSDSGFIYWFLTQDAIVDQLHTIAEQSTSAYPSITPSDIERLRLALPPLAEQQAIAHILGTLDDKIELNRRINETLEAKATTIFKDWFVDFGPVRAKMEGLEPYLPKEIWNLFPSTLSESDSGLIPNLWHTKPLGECFKLTLGQSPPSRSYNKVRNGLPFFQGSTEFDVRYPNTRRYCSEPTRIAQAGDTLVSVRAPVGKINMAWENYCIGRGVASLMHLSAAASYTYYAIKSICREIEEFQDSGTVFGAITRRQFEDIRVLEPDPKVIFAFDKLVGSLDERIRLNVAQSRTLSILRDFLIPKLISGELRVSDLVKE